MEGMGKTAEELAAETWPDDDRMEPSAPVELTLEDALAILRGEGGGDGD